MRACALVKIYKRMMVVLGCQPFYSLVCAEFGKLRELLVDYVHFRVIRWAFQSILYAEITESTELCGLLRREFCQVHVDCFFR